MIGFKNFMAEGVNDPAIFKAVFLAGGPGSGKSFVVGKTALTALGYRLINSDEAFEKALAKAGMEANPENIFSDKGQEIRNTAKVLTAKKMHLALQGRLGLVIDGTGKDYEKIKKQVDHLRQIGYVVMMLFVNTDLDTALEMNRQRARTLPDGVVKDMWNGVQKNIGKFQSLFRNRMVVVDNSASNRSNSNAILNSAYKQVAKWTKEEVKNPQASAWIKQQKSERGIKEEHGAGDWGTDKLTNKFKKDTPFSEDGNWMSRGIGKFTHAKAYNHAAKVLQQVWDRKKKEAKHSKEYYAAQIARQYSGVDARELTKMVK